MKGLYRVIYHLTIGLLTLVSLLCLELTFDLNNIQPFIVLLVLDLLFLSLFFQLRGSLIKKTALLTTGNILGLLLNYLFHGIDLAGRDLFGEPFRTFFSLAYPILTLVWAVPFWSFSLSCLPKPKNDILP